MVISKHDAWSGAPMGEECRHVSAGPSDATTACERAAVDAAVHSAMALAGGLLMQYQKAWERSGEIPAEQNIYDLIIPNFNAPDVLKACLDSLIATTDPKHVIHVIDDASTDPRVDPMMRSYVARHPHIRYYRLPVNLGFPGAVNAGFASTERDVILVNSDTEYPPNWLARMDRCRRSDPAIHAVCPLSNNATICSVPGFNQKNVLPPNTTLADMDRLVQHTSLRRYPRAPTVVGFCMLMTRHAIEAVGPFDMTFGRGYGEEVDWCQRAWARGYASVICDDVYVYHHGEVGFSQVPEKQFLRQTNERLVAKRWPDYEPSVRAFCAANPLRFQQQRMFEALRHRSDAKLRVLHVTHNFDALAGTELFIRQLVDGMRDDAASSVLFPAPMSPFQDGVVEEEGRGLLRGGLLKVRMNGNLFSTEHSVHGVGISFRSQLTERFFAEVLAGSGASIVQFNHLANLGSLELPLLAKALGAKVVVVLHDYFLLCPDWNLLHANGKACGEPMADSRSEKCVDCLGRKIQTRSSTPFAVRDIIDERSWHCRNVLERADALVAPSEFVRDQFTRAWGTEIGGRIRVIPHGTVAHPFEPDYEPQSSLRVAFLGNATVQKGIDTFTEAARLMLGSAVHFRIIGPMPPGSAISVPGNVEQSGSYPQRELSRRLQGVDVVFIGSIANETYCFTVDESFRAGVPVIATAMGAIPERVADGKTGILIPPGDALALVSAIERLDRDRALLAAMRRNVGQLRLRSTKEAVTAYGQLYAELTSDGAYKEARHVLGEGSLQSNEAVVGLDEFAAAKGLEMKLPMMPEGLRTAGVSQKKAKRT